jgi:LmbE family N-acetylglucosaminyl deacetylase
MNLNLPDVKEVLILAPHPDDEALGCSGAIFQLNAMGASSTIVFLTDGEQLYGEPNRNVAEKRRNEGLKSSEMLGCREPIFLGFPDGGIATDKKHIYSRLSSIIGLKKPDIIFSPSLVDYHDDHIATARIAVKLLKTLGSFELAFYEVYSLQRFTHLIDISSVMEQKQRIIMNYETSLYGKPGLYANAILGLNAFRSIFLQKEGYYETFFIMRKADELEKAYEFLCYKDYLSQ